MTIDYHNQCLLNLCKEYLVLEHVQLNKLNQKCTKDCVKMLEIKFTFFIGWMCQRIQIYTKGYVLSML